MPVMSVQTPEYSSPDVRPSEVASGQRRSREYQYEHEPTRFSLLRKNDQAKT
jgi:hypothetical protein